MSRKLLNAVLLTLVGILLVVTPVLAYLYKAPIAITENASTAYTMLPIMWDQSNTWLASNGFMSSSGNDTRVQTLGGLNKPHLVCDNKTLTAVPVPANSQTNLYFVTGESAQVMDIITGYGGYITTADAVALEPSGNFSITYSGYVNTDNVSENFIVKKHLALSLAVSPTISGNITGMLYDTVTNINQMTVTQVDNVYGGRRAGQYISAGTGVITQVKFYLAKTGTPTGTGYARIRRASDDSLVGTLGSVNVATLGGAAWSTFSTTPVYVFDIPIRICFEFDGGDAGNYITVYRNPADTIAGERTYYDGAAWTDDGTQDRSIQIAAYITTRFVSVAGVPSGENTITLSADSTNLTLTVDGIGSDTITLGGVATTNTTTDWVWMLSSSTLYADNITVSIGGTRQLYYCPQTMIIGTVLPDREGGDQNGVITWGSNPAGVGVVLGSMTSSGQPSIGSTEDTSTSDILPVVGGTDWRPVPGVSVTLQANPIRPIVTAISDNSTLSEYQVWVWFGIIFVVFVTVLVGANVRGHHLITGIAASATLILLVVWTIFPWGVLPVIVLAIWGGLVSERSPSL